MFMLCSGIAVGMQKLHNAFKNRSSRYAKIAYQINNLILFSPQFRLAIALKF